jgi:hypothetical protein
MVYFIFKLIPRSKKHANLLTTYVHLKLFLIQIILFNHY